MIKKHNEKNINIETIEAANIDQLYILCNCKKNCKKKRTSTFIQNYFYDTFIDTL